MAKLNSREEEVQRNIEEYSGMVYRLAMALMKNSSDADDIFQEVFLRYLRRRPEFQSGEHKKAWFLRVTVNCCKNLWGCSWYTKTVGMEERQEMFEKQVFLEEKDADVYYAVKSLPEKYRVLIHLFYYEEMSAEEIGRVLKRKPSTVRTQLTRARKKLQEILKEEI